MLQLVLVQSCNLCCTNSSKITVLFSHVAFVNFKNIKSKTTVIDPSVDIEIKIINSCSCEGSSDQLLGEQLIFDWRIP